MQFYKIILYFNPGHQHSSHPKLNKSIFIIFLQMKLLLNRRNNNGYYNSNGQAELQTVSQFDSEFTYSYFPTVAFQNKNSPSLPKSKPPLVMSATITGNCWYFFNSIQDQRHATWPLSRSSTAQQCDVQPKSYRGLPDYNYKLEQHLREYHTYTGPFQRGR